MSIRNLTEQKAREHEALQIIQAGLPAYVRADLSVECTLTLASHERGWQALQCLDQLREELSQWREDPMAGAIVTAIDRILRDRPTPPPAQEGCCG